MVQSSGGMMADDFFSGLPDDITLELRGPLEFRGSRIRITPSADSRIAQIIKNLRSKASGDEFARILDQVLQEAISASIWRTRNGVDDIIDSGDLSRSLEISRTANGLVISYDVPYANLIHYGGYIVPYGNTNAQRVYIPPRPWVATVLSGRYGGFDPEDVYFRIITRLLT